MTMLPSLPWIRSAETVLGLHEIRDIEALSRYLRSDGKTLGNPSKMPWCGDLVDTAINKALPKEPRYDALRINPYWALNWNGFGVPSGGEYYGSVITLKRTGGGHVGFLVGISEDGKYYLVLGGNQDNKVSRKWIPKNKAIQAIRWPATFPNPKTPLPVYKRTGKVLVNMA